MKKHEGFTDREVALLDEWDEYNRPQIDDASEARVLEAVHEAGCLPCGHELDPLLAAKDEAAVVMWMALDAATASLELWASESEDRRSSELEGAVLRQEKKPSGEDAPDAHTQKTPVTGLLRVVE